MDIDYIPPFTVIPMPLDKDGNGPADKDNAVKVVYQVWDAACQTVSEHGSQLQADFACAERNNPERPTTYIPVGDLIELPKVRKQLREAAKLAIKTHPKRQKHHTAKQRQALTTRLKNHNSIQAQTTRNKNQCSQPSPLPVASLGSNPPELLPNNDHPLNPAPPSMTQDSPLEQPSTKPTEPALESTSGPT